MLTILMDINTGQVIHWKSLKSICRCFLRLKINPTSNSRAFFKKTSMHIWTIHQNVYFHTLSLSLSLVDVMRTWQMMSTGLVTQMVVTQMWRQHDRWRALVTQMVVTPLSRLLHQSRGRSAEATAEPEPESRAGAGPALTAPVSHTRTQAEISCQATTLIVSWPDLRLNNSV